VQIGKGRNVVAFARGDRGSSRDNLLVRSRSQRRCPHRERTAHGTLSEDHRQAPTPLAETPEAGTWTGHRSRLLSGGLGRDTSFKPSASPEPVTARGPSSPSPAPL
jgi:hypothetical protein